MDKARYKDKTLMITGGTGSFGTAVLEGFLQLGLKEIRIFSRDEKKQYDMRQKLQSDLVTFHIGDVREYDSIYGAMHGVDIVFSAAALKQVPSCEFHPMEAVKTNILGAANVIRAASARGVGSVICLSTDKAVYPVNAMGMSKALMEKVMVAEAVHGTDKRTCVVGTRYGNVMASRGSVIPLFLEQILLGRPVTVTDPEMTRFLMTLPEAVELVLYAYENGEPGDLFVQKSMAATMGDLAQALIEIFNSKSEIQVIGTRHGEKKHETLLNREERVRSEDLGRYYRVRPDVRGLNYSKYFSEGEMVITEQLDYSSDTAERLDVPALKRALSGIDIVRDALRPAT